MFVYILLETWKSKIMAATHIGSFVHVFQSFPRLYFNSILISYHIKKPFWVNNIHKNTVPWEKYNPINIYFIAWSTVSSQCNRTSLSHRSSCECHILELSSEFARAHNYCRIQQGGSPAYTWIQTNTSVIVILVIDLIAINSNADSMEGIEIVSQIAQYIYSCLQSDFHKRGSLLLSAAIECKR